MSQAKYRLSGIDRSIVTASSKMGSVHMVFTSSLRFRQPMVPRDGSESEPLGSDECRPQINEQ
jgi:hypothetical protein